MRIVTVTNQKGGVSKTTTAFSLGVGLQKRGYKVLFVDLDAQSNLSFTAQVDLLNIPTNLYEVFKGKATAKDAIINIDKNLDILVGSIDLASADREFLQLGREKMLAKALKPLSASYDYCIIDTPPTLGVMNENALTASDNVIIPMQVEVYALQGTNQLYGFISSIMENSNPALKISGILLTRVDERTNLYKAMKPQFDNVAQMMHTKVFKSFIRETVAVKEVAIQRGNLFDETPNATATKDYIAFIDEFLNDITI